MPDPQLPPLPPQPVVTPSARTIEGQTKENVGIQAARFSLYAPFAILLVSFCSSTAHNGDNAKDSAGVAVGLAWLNIALIVAGFALGLFALASVSKFGKKGILFRSLTGVILNGLLVWGLVTIFWPMLAARGMADRLVGTWQMTSGASVAKGAALDVSFRADKTFDFGIAQPGGVVTRVFGTYKFTTGDQAIGIVVDRVDNGDTKMVGEHILLGRVVEVDAKRLRLGTKSGDELYDRR